MSGLDGHDPDVHLPPVFPSLVIQPVQDLSHVVVAVVREDVVARLLVLLVGQRDCLVPLLGGVFLVIQHQIFQGFSEGQFSTVHGSHAYEVIDGAV